MLQLRPNFSRSPLGAVNQAPPGPYTVAGGAPLTTLEQCSSFDGVIFTDGGGDLCCATPASPGGSWFCRRFVPGVVSAVPPSPTQPAPVPAPVPAPTPTLAPAPVPGQTPPPTVAPTVSQGSLIPTPLMIGMIAGGLLGLAYLARRAVPPSPIEA